MLVDSGVGTIRDTCLLASLHNSFRPQDFITSCLPILTPTQPGKHFLDAVVGVAALLKCLDQSDLILAM